MSLVGLTATPQEGEKSSEEEEEISVEGLSKGQTTREPSSKVEGKEGREGENTGEMMGPRASSTGTPSDEVIGAGGSSCIILRGKRGKMVYDSSKDTEQLPVREEEGGSLSTVLGEEVEGEELADALLGPTPSWEIPRWESFIKSFFREAMTKGN